VVACYCRTPRSVRLDRPVIAPTDATSEAPKCPACNEPMRSIFHQACKMGLEGIVSKRLSAPYKSGPSRDWIKVKNPDSPAMVRHRNGRW
jgi:ATP-dependent DNA ligase